jgi:PilZ domain
MDDVTAQEKRAIRRFALQLPVTVTAASGEQVKATAQTKDVSSHGICFYCDAAMERGSAIEFTVTLPTEVTMTEAINVRCLGTVVRVDGKTAGKFAVAAVIDSYEFVADDDQQKIIPAAAAPTL